MSVKLSILRRFLVIRVIFLIITVLILGKVFVLQWVEGDYWRGKAEAVTYRTSPIQARRGNILTAKGELLAASAPYYDIRFDPMADGISGSRSNLYDENIDSLSRCLANLFQDKTADQYRRMFDKARSTGNRYLLVNRRIDYIKLSKLRKFPIFNRGKAGGLIVETVNERVYPFGELAYRFLGTTTADTTVGIEGSFNVYLRGKNGLQTQQKITGGWMPIPSRTDKDPVDGYDVVTTLDIRMQDIVQGSLRKRLEELSAEHGSAIVMETSTGDIKAMSSLQLYQGAYHERLNYAIGEAMEPGSTFKLYSYLTMLDDGYITPDSIVDNGNGNWVFAGKNFHDDHRESTLGKITVQKAFAMSSNISVAKLALKYYRDNPDKFLARLEHLKLTEPFGLQIAGEAQTFFQNPSSRNRRGGWSALSLPQMSTGYEVRLAPIHTLTLYNAVANGGKMVKPRFVTQIKNESGVVEEYPVVVLQNQICSPNTLDKLHQMLEEVVLTGTAKAIRSDYYKIAGKTGTAQIAAGTAGYRQERKYYATFVGYFPADNPKYSCIVTIYGPHGATGGGTASAPVFKEISDRIYSTAINIHETASENKDTLILPVSKSGSYAALRRVFRQLEIPFDTSAAKGSEWVTTRNDGESIQIQDRELVEGILPDVTDMGLKDAVFILEKAGYKVSTSGYGRVRRQYPQAGTALHAGGTVRIELS